MQQTVTHTNKNLLISPRKLRLTAKTLINLNPQKAVDRLKLTPGKSARFLVKSLKNVIADAKNNFGLEPSTLKIQEVRVDEGMKLKRMDRSHGSRFNRGLIMKRHSRIAIAITGVKKEVEKKEEKVKGSSTKKVAPKKVTTKSEK